MKNLVFLTIGVLTLSVVSVRAQLTLNVGESFDYSFSALPGPFRTQDNVLGAAAFLESGGSIFIGSGTVLFELFEEGITGTADSQFTITLETWGDDPAYVRSESLWADLDGSFRVTSLGGSVTFDKVGIYVAKSGVFPEPESTGFYQVVITPVPEPSAIALGILGSAALLFWKRK